MREWKFSKIIVTALGAVLIAVLCLVIHLRLSCMGNSDHAVCALQSLEMLKAHTPFPPNWVGATYVELRTFPVLLGFLFTRDFVLATEIGAYVTLSLVVTTFACFWRCTQRNLASLLFGLIILSQQSDMMTRHFFVYDYYTQFLIGILLFFSAWAMSERVGRYWMWAFPLFAFVVNLMGIRMSVLVTIPYLAAMFVDRRWNRQMFCVLALSFAGNVIYEKILLPLFGISHGSYVDGLCVFADDASMILGNLHNYLDGVLKLLQFPAGKSILCIRGLLSSFICLVSVAFTVGFPLLTLREWRHLGKWERLVLVTSLVSFVETSVILIFFHQLQGGKFWACARYLELPQVLMYLVSCQYVVRHVARLPKRIVLLVSAMIVCSLLVFSLNGICTPITEDNRAETRALSDCLRAMNVRRGYATHWNANVHRYFSNGEIDIAPVCLDTNGNMWACHWLSSMDWFAVRPGRSFLLLTDEERARFLRGTGRNRFGLPTEERKLGKLNILVYDFDIGEHDFRSGTGGDRK